MTEIYHNSKVNNNVNHDKNSITNLSNINLESSLCFPKEIFYGVKQF